MGPSFLQRLCPPCTPAVALAAAAAAAPAWLAPVRPHVTPRRRPAAPRLLGPGHPRLAPACLRRSSSSTSAGNGCDMTKYPPEKIRNFSIIAHIDHGKSTLADRLLEITGTIAKSGENKQVLDKLKVERDRGITVKAQTVSMFHNGYLLNLIDTPGHVDFSYEVSRSLAACQGTLLLVDASKGVQAQTVANFYLAFGQDITIIPIINKVDLDTADPDKVAEEIHNVFELDPTSIVKISAKTGLNVEEIFPNVLENIPPPQGDIHKPLKALLFDQWYDKYQGVVCMTAIIDGTVCKGDKVMSAHTKIKYEVHELGIMSPEKIPVDRLQAGQVGYLVLNMRSLSEAHIGDTFHEQKRPVEPLPGFAPVKPMVFAGLYPVESLDYPRLEASIEQLSLNDTSVSVSKETSPALGAGFRLGFLGSLHMDVFQQRLSEEYGSEVIITQPTVPYKIIYKDGQVKLISNPADFPDLAEISTKVAKVQEPMILATLIFPVEYMGKMMELFGTRRGEQLEFVYLDHDRCLVKYKFPLSEIVAGFYDALKSRSSGYATFDYEECGYEDTDLTKLTVMIHGTVVDPLCVVLHASDVEKVARDWAVRLKALIKRHQFDVAIQVVAGTKVVARETVKAIRKDVTAKCYGGDPTRKLKLILREKERVKRLKMVGRVELSQEAFLSFIKNED